MKKPIGVEEICNMLNTMADAAGREYLSPINRGAGRMGPIYISRDYWDMYLTLIPEEYRERTVMYRGIDVEILEKEIGVMRL